MHIPGSFATLSSNLKLQGAQDSIGIFTAFAAQLRLHRRMSMAEDVAMSTMDGAREGVETSTLQNAASAVLQHLYRKGRGFTSAPPPCLLNDLYDIWSLRAQK